VRIQLDASAESLEQLRRACGETRQEVSAVSIRRDCRGCGERYFATLITPSVCPFCGSDDIEAVA
jgi:predicted Zn-ribbon and HTH transcriptional regulator